YLPRKLTWTRTPIQVLNLTNQLQRLSRIPIIFCADLEHGLSQRFKIGVTPLPVSMSVGATRSEKYAYYCGKIVSQEAQAVGIQMVLGPVMDVNTNPANPIINTRSFGERPDLVSSLGAAYISGCQESGCIATAKHFPGHGDTSTDTHLTMPIVSHSFKRLEEVELPPFKAAVDTGVKAVMGAHIEYPALEPTSGLPATFSYRIMTGLLREKLGFKGIIVTDALAMRAIADNFGDKEAVIRSVKAGADVVLPADSQVAFEALLEAVRNRQISEKRIDDSVEKILNVKAWLGMDKQWIIEPAKAEKVIGRQENAQLVKEIARAAITLLKNEHLLPLSNTSQKKVLLISTEERSVKGSRAKIFEETFGGLSRNEILERELLKRIGSLNFMRIDENPSYLEMSRVRKEVEKVDMIIFASFISVRSYKSGSGTISERQIELVRSLQDKVPLLFIAFGSPYVIANFQQAKAIICAYGSEPALIEATVETIFGEIQPKGKLPVTISKEYSYGYSLSY
ncbi:glycoside hydrolase family 3 C-terminal domain-containing protein, partial [Candidatus Calescamantes bacterium]|nr:glycoside hydrolase family 3 C-terminal domain-containing protein [Candidatus Calescamantes bacterium]